MNNLLFSLITVNQSILPESNYYVIDNFPFPCFIHDENGVPISFTNYSEAAAEANLCQNGYVIIFNYKKII